MKILRFLCLTVALLLVLGFAYYLDKSPALSPVPNDGTISTETEEVSLKGKTILNFGDSIFGNYSAPNDISSRLAYLTNATVYNVAFGGCRMSVHQQEQYNAFSMCTLAEAIAQKDWTVQNTMMARQDWKPNATYAGNLAALQAVDFNEVDMITISYGTNDFTANCAIASSDPYDTATFAGALRYSIETILSAYPDIEVVLCTPTYRFWMDKDNNYAFLDDSTTREIGGRKLTDFVQATKEVAAEYDLYCIDNYNGSGICYENRTACFPQNDGTHPNQTGIKMIADHMAKVLLEHYT